MPTSRIHAIGFIAPRSNSRLRQLVVEDAVVRTTSRDALAALGTGTQPDVDLPSLLALLAEAEPQAAFSRALRILNCRERSTTEIRRRLLEDGYPEHVVTATLDRLASAFIVDDARFAASCARSKRRAGWGRRRTARLLRDAGVDDSTALCALDDSYAPDDDETIARAAIAAKPPRSAVEARRLTARLTRRGIPPGLANSLVRDALEMLPPTRHTSHTP